jgi:hypothetical protein
MVNTVFPTRNYFFPKKQRGKAPRNLSLLALHKFLVWSFNHLASGVWPSEPYPGTRFSKVEKAMAGSSMQWGRSFVMCAKGDWKYAKEAFQLTRSWLHRVMLGLSCSDICALL